MTLSNAIVGSRDRKVDALPISLISSSKGLCAMTKKGLPYTDLTGKRFGRLVVLSYVKSGKWLCHCDCGNDKIIQTGHLNGGITISCRCFAKENSSKIHKTHGYSHHDLYSIYSNMIGRCHNPNNHKYYMYGKRGIAVCDPWRESFENFLIDMGKRPSQKHSIERLDNNKGYSKDNCEWHTIKEQTRNRRSNIYVEVNGEKMCLIDACKIVGLNYATVQQRVTKYNWNINDALTIKSRKQKKG